MRGRTFFASPLATAGAFAIERLALRQMECAFEEGRMICGHQAIVTMPVYLGLAVGALVIVLAGGRAPASKRGPR